jgi:Cu/Ag efflux protein CusF
MQSEPILRALVAAAAVLATSVPLAAAAQSSANTTTKVDRAPGTATATETTTATATVVAVDPAHRLFSLKLDKGRVVEMEAGPEVRNFDQIKVGDTVRAEYVRSLTLSLKKDGKGTPGQSSSTQTMGAAPGETPAARTGSQVTLLADVLKVNKEANSLTLRGPNGKIVDLAIADPAQLALVKVGDQVEAVYTEALALKLEPATPAK